MEELAFLSSLYGQGEEESGRGGGSASWAWRSSHFDHHFVLTGGPMMQVRNFAVMTGVNAGITYAMKQFRGGVEDVQTSMVAAFGSGAIFFVVSGMGAPNVVGNAVAIGAVFALLQGGIYKVCLAVCIFAYKAAVNLLI
ncbi:unnamed protein product [Calypogeia fissa]